MVEDIKWLFFDIGSTLVNEEKVYAHRMRDMANAVHEPLEKIAQIMLHFYAQNQKGDLETAQLLGLPKQKWYFEDETLYEDTILCLDYLSKYYKIGIIANQALGTKERLKKFGLLKYIDLVIASAEEGIAKPDKRLFNIALQRSGCEPNHAMMIGDRIDHDILPAKSLGFHTIWIKQGFGKYWRLSSEAETPDYTVTSLTELLNILHPLI